MKKNFVIMAFTALIISICCMSCEKEETLKNYYNGKNSSYDGNDFSYDNTYTNPYEQFGVYHNDLFKLYEKDWKSISSGENLSKELLTYAVNYSDEVTGLNVEEAGFSKENFASLPIEEDDNSIEELSDKEQIENLFMVLGDDYLKDFITDVENALSDEYSYQESFEEICLIEQKIAHTKLNSNSKRDYLIFCAVLKYSVMNIDRIQNDPSSPFNISSKGKLSTWGKISVAYADAKGAVQGARMGIAAGAAAGSAILGTVGAVCVGGMRSAVKYAISANIHQQ